MEKATFVNATYDNSSTITHQGNRSSIQRYLHQGYRIVDERNGYWILNKPSSLTVILKDSNNIIHSFNMKEDILEHYGRQRIILPYSEVTPDNLEEVMKKALNYMTLLEVLSNEKLL